MSVITKSRIAGEFYGWTGDGVYELENGQRWEQVRYRYRYRYKYRPRATVVRCGGQYFLDVDGMSDPIQVRKL